jgi:pimeloyl-ACP methyl ester carboxylesterase
MLRGSVAEHDSLLTHLHAPCRPVCEINQARGNLRREPERVRCLCAGDLEATVGPPCHSLGYRIRSRRKCADERAHARVIVKAAANPPVVAAHSYGGAVITAAAAGRPNVRALVYVTAFAPDEGEVFAALLGRFGDSDINTAIAPDAAGAFYIDLAKFNEVFAGDLPAEQASVMAAAQKPFAGSIFGASVEGAPAWKSIPSWYVVARNDRVIKPELQRFMAERMGARTSEVDSSHVAYVSHPNEIARLIDEAASSVAGAVAAT